MIIIVEFDDSGSIIMNLNNLNIIIIKHNGSINVSLNLINIIGEYNNSDDILLNFYIAYSNLQYNCLEYMVCIGCFSCVMYNMLFTAFLFLLIIFVSILFNCVSIVCMYMLYCLYSINYCINCYCC